MADQPDPMWTLGAVALGGFLTIIGQIVADQWKFRQEIRHENRNRLREHLYSLQDQMALAFDLTRRIVNDRNDPMTSSVAQLFLDTTELENVIGSMGTHTVRVGDDPLSEHVHTTVKALLRTAKSTSDDRKNFQAAKESLKDAQYRIGELLHTDRAVDLGVENNKRSRVLRRRGKPTTESITAEDS